MAMPFQVPVQLADGSLSNVALVNNTFQAATNPEAIYPDHTTQSRFGQLTNMQVKLCILALLNQCLMMMNGNRNGRSPGLVDHIAGTSEWHLPPS